jgi:hypothetical protein
VPQPRSHRRAGAAANRKVAAKQTARQLNICCHQLSSSICVTRDACSWNVCGAVLLLRTYLFCILHSCSKHRCKGADCACRLLRCTRAATSSTRLMTRGSVRRSSPCWCPCWPHWAAASQQETSHQHRRGHQHNDMC